MGVDIFFVISGYLISSLIFREINNNNFSIVNFYERRARRIIPALSLMMFLSSLLAFFFLLPKEIIKYGESLIANSFFLSNFYFWTESGYFDENSQSIPLIHTWSLSVEEQFYVLFPVLLLIMKNFKKNLLFFILILIFIFSLAISEWGWRNNGNLNFYFSITRAWEILMGTFIALISYKINHHKIPRSNGLSLVGVFLVAGSLYFFDEKTQHPSLLTLLPLLGVSLIVLYAHQGTVVHNFLTNKVLVTLGLISYSLYLFHLPLFFFAEVYFGKNLDVQIYLLLILISIGLSWLSWKYFEMYFRDRNNLSSKTIL